MSKVLRVVLLCVVVTALVWLVTLWHWQTAGRDVSGAEIVGQLVVLPIALTGVLLLAVWGASRLRVSVGASAAKPVVLTPPVQPGMSGAATLVTPSDDRLLSVAVLQAAVHLSAQGSSEQALAQMREGKVRPSLDPELQDLDGAPVFTARLPDLDVDALRDSLPPKVSDRVVRALALLLQPTDQLLERVVELAQSWPVARAPQARPSLIDIEAMPSMKAHLSGMAPVASAAASRAATLPRLSLRLAVPATWTEAEREHAAAWLRMRSATLASENDALREATPTPHVHALEQPDALWALLDQQTLQWSREALPQWGVVLVADSALDAHEIERRQAVGDLFTGAHQTGRIPGEGAAGLLLTTLNWPGLGEQVPMPARLQRPARLRRDKSADAFGRVGPAVLQDAMCQALNVCAALPTDLVCVVADADHRASRTAELFEALQGVAPGLDPMLSVTRVGDACGDLGLASALVPVALAAGLAQQDDAAGVTLAVLVQATHERMAVALLPWTWTPPAAQAAT
jgi:hypothetical protein